MSGRGASSLLLSMAAFLGSARADDIQWRPASQPNAPPTQPGAVQHSLGVTLGRPVPALHSSGSVINGVPDREIFPAAFAPSPVPRFTRVVRAQASDDPPPLLSAGLMDAQDETPPAREESAKAAPPPGPAGAVVPVHPVHPFVAVPFPYATDHWTRTTAPAPDVEVGPWGPHEDLEDIGPPLPVPCRLYGSAEYLLWWTRPANLPPLVTTGTPASQGILGQPGTALLFGGAPVDFGGQSGARFTAGYWLNCDDTLAIEGSLFFLGQENVKFNANSDLFPVLARPFFAINPGVPPGEFRQLTAFPGLFTGAISATTATRLWGAEVDARCKGCCGLACDCGYRIDWLAGVRYLELNDNVHVNEAIQFMPGVLANLPVGGTGFVFDSFGTRNQFVGGQIGTDIELRHGCWSLDLKAKIAIGDTHETVNINGGQLLVDPRGFSTAFQGGLLALPSNIGRFSRDQFGVVPEFGIQLGYNFTERLKAFVGYNFLYWSNVLRAGDQIDRNIDVTQIPNFSAPGAVPVGQTRPAVLFRETSFWAQGLTVGVEWKY